MIDATNAPAFILVDPDAWQHIAAIEEPENGDAPPPGDHNPPCYVRRDLYAALKAENERLLALVKALGG